MNTGRNELSDGVTMMASRRHRCPFAEFGRPPRPVFPLLPQIVRCAEHPEIQKHEHAAKDTEQNRWPLLVVRGSPEAGSPVEDPGGQDMHPHGSPSIAR